MKIILREFVLSFHDLWQPKSIAGGEPKYSATLIATPDSSFKYDGKINPAKAIAAAVKKVREEKWPDLNEVAAKKIKVWCWNKADGSTTREQYVAFREQKDAELEAPALILQSIQVTIEGGALNGVDLESVDAETIGPVALAAVVRSYQTAFFVATGIAIAGVLVSLTLPKRGQSSAVMAESR